MLSVGDKMPDFKLNAMVSIENFNEAFKVISNEDFEKKWYCLFFWPKDFTFVCPTEIAEFGRKELEFKKRGCSVLGCSVDSEVVHFAWKEQNKLLRDNVNFPMLSDLKRELCDELGILTEEGVAMRATFLVDPEGIIKFVYTTDGKVGRNVNEVLRVLDALQTDEMCPCGWNLGDDTIKLK